MTVSEIVIDIVWIVMVLSIMLIGIMLDWSNQDSKWRNPSWWVIPLFAIGVGKVLGSLSSLLFGNLRIWSFLIGVVLAVGTWLINNWQHNLD